MNRSSSLVQAATVLNSLPKLQAAKVLSRLEPGDIKTVLDAMTRLDYISASEIASALQRFSDETKGLPEAVDSEELTNVQCQVDSAIDALHQQVEDAAEPECPFDFLVDVIPMVRIHLLADEHPKNIAIVLSMLPPEIASLTLKGIEEQLRISVLRRLCEIEEVSQQEVAELRFALNQRLHRLMNSGRVNEDGINAAIRLLSCSETGMRDELLAQIRQTDPDLAYKLQRSAFKIERLLTLENVEIKVVLRHVDTSSWAPALKNAPTAVVEKILTNMAPEPSDILRLEIDQIGFVGKPIQDLARQNIIQVVLKLARERKIELRKNGPRKKDGNYDGKAIEIIIPSVESIQSTAWNATSLMR